MRQHWRLLSKDTRDWIRHDFPALYDVARKPDRRAGHESSLSLPQMLLAG
ncbi:hypothetical protein GCM10023317_44300 [Actinopolymorpha pittospori]